MSYNTRLTEECPLTKEKDYKYKLCSCNGLRFIIICFVTLTFAITTMLVLQIFYTETISQISLHGAVATDYSNCSQIGTKILRRLGNSVDAAIAATICMTVVAPHKTGLGGSGRIMIYNYKNYTHPIVINIVNNTAKEGKVRLPILLQGLEFVQKSYGSLPWHDVVKPSVKLAREGFVVSKDFVEYKELSKNAYYRMLYDSLNPGDTLRLPELANTLDIVAEYGSKVLYNGTLAHKISHSGILHEESLEQLASYNPTVTSAKNSTLHGYTVYYPSDASFMQTVIEALESLPISAENASTIESQALVAHALMNLNLSLFQNKQHAKTYTETYTGVMAMDWQDTYVSILSGLSTPLGLGNMTDAGFLLDNIDDDNLSTFIPIIFHSKKGICELRGVFGSNDAFLNGQILYNLIIRALNVSTAIEYPRYYPVPSGVMIENNQRHSVDAALRARLHSTISSLTFDDSLLKSVNAIIKTKDLLSSHSDSRGNGIASRF